MRLNDLTGQTFGRLTVLRRVENSPGTKSAPSGFTQYECQCSCPNHTILIVRGSNLKNGHVTSCGCLRREQSSERMKSNSEAHRKSKEAIFNDLTGRTFGRLTVIKRVENSNSTPSCPGGRVQYLCRCIEGNECVVLASHLVSGKIQSCGCLARERASEARRIWTDEEATIVSILNGMKQRCCNQNSAAYENYGGRGIYICNEWMDPITGKRAFVDWAKSSGYQPGLEIDRINNDGPYSPSNCRWVNRFVQQNNTRKNIVINIDGVTHTLSEWARLVNVSYKYLHSLWSSGEFEACKNAIRYDLARRD